MKKLLTLLLLLHCIGTGFSQTNPIRVNANHLHTWGIATGNIKISNKFSAFYDFQFRRSDVISNWQQLLLRGAGLYQFHDNVQAGIGYAFVYNWPYGDFPASIQTSENRIFEQISLTQSAGPWALLHRYRIEQRFLGGTTPRFENRFRYMLRARLPIVKAEGFMKVYLNLFDEVFLNAGKKVGRNVFDQNRIGASIGYSFNKNFMIEAGYLLQLIQQRGLQAGTNANIMENNHTLTLTLSKNFDLMRD